MDAAPAYTGGITMDHAIAGWSEAGYTLISRAEHEALLVRKRRFPAWGYLFALLAGVGLVFFAGMHLVSRVPAVHLFSDENDMVERAEHKMCSVKRSSLLLGIACLASSSALIAGVPVVALGLFVNSSTAGVHVCSLSSFDYNLHHCTGDTHVLTVSQFGSAYYSAGTPLFGGTRIRDLTVQITGTGSGLAFVSTDDDTGARLVYGQLNYVFKLANVAVEPGSYVLTMRGGQIDSLHDLGTYTLTIVQ